MRKAVLEVAGDFCNISPGLHILNGHSLIFGEEKRFRDLLVKLRNRADFIDFAQAVKLLEGLNSDIVQRECHIAFSFDDGYVDCFQRIQPLLSEFGVTGAYFVNPPMLGQSKGSESAKTFFRLRAPEITPCDFMTESMVKELSLAGCVIGAHTMDHLRLADLSEEQIFEQLKMSQSQVEAITGGGCEYFAWPYGKYRDIGDMGLHIASSCFKYVFSSDRYPSYFTPFANGRIYNRRHFECNWPEHHLRFMLRKKRTIKRR